MNGFEGACFGERPSVRAKGEEVIVRVEGENLSPTTADFVNKLGGKMSRANPIGESNVGASDGISIATETVRLWLENEPSLLQRARQIIRQDVRDHSKLFPWWVEFMLYGAPYGGFDLNTEPEHDYRAVQDVKRHMGRDDFRRINWDFIRESLLAE